MDTNRLKEDVSDKVTKMFEQILDYAEVAVSDNDRYRKFRSKVLRVGNNCIRNIHEGIDDGAWFTVDQKK